MVIDEEEQYILSHYIKRKGKTYVKNSDHLPQYIDLSIEYSKKKPARNEFFNLKNKENFKHFKKTLDHSTNLRDCLNEPGNILNKAKY